MHISTQVKRSQKVGNPVQQSAESMEIDLENALHC